MSKILFLREKPHILSHMDRLMAKGTLSPFSCPFVKTDPADTSLPIIHKYLAFFFRKGLSTKSAISLTSKYTHQYFSFHLVIKNVTKL